MTHGTRLREARQQSCTSGQPENMVVWALGRLGGRSFSTAEAACPTRICAPLVKDAAGIAVPGAAAAGPPTTQPGNETGPYLQSCTNGRIATGSPTSWGDVMNALTIHCTRVAVP